MTDPLKPGKDKYATVDDNEASNSDGEDTNDTTGKIPTPPPWKP